jgi:hypothetical protein
MKQKFELFKQNGEWSDNQDFDETPEIYVYFQNEITEQVEECHGFPQTVYFNEIEIIDAEVNGFEPTLIELDHIFNEINSLDLNQFNEL